jgi:hypothetical protein
VDGKTKLNLSFSSAPLEELNNDWLVKSGDSNSIRLEDVENNEESYLNFEKI